MKITNIVGSPRKNGNSATIARALLERLQAEGVISHTHRLNELDYHGCQGCMECKTKTDRCVVRDGLTAVLEDIRASDVVLFSSPIYSGEITGQAKGLLDRFYSFLTPDFRTNPRSTRLAAGKKMVFIVPQGNPDASLFADVIARYQRYFTRMGFEDLFIIRAVGAGPDADILKNETVARAIAETAGKIAVRA